MRAWNNYGLMNAARKTRARGFTLDPAPWFHALLTRRSLPLSRCAKHHSIPDRQRTAFADSLRLAIFFPRYSSGSAFESGAAARYNKTHARSFRAVPPICGDTPLFFSSFSFFFLPFLYFDAI